MSLAVAGTLCSTWGIVEGGWKNLDEEKRNLRDQ